MDKLLPMSPDSFVTYVSRPYQTGPNKPLVPTRNGEAPLLAAQRQR